MIRSARYLASDGSRIEIEAADGTRWTTDPRLPADTDMRRALREWMDAGNAPEAHSEAPPPMPTLSARQLRLGMLGLGISQAQVDAAIGAIPDERARAAALIEWEYATTFERSHPLIGGIAAALGMDDEQLDAAWRQAATI